MSRYAVLYHCHPINNGLQNLSYFLRHGLEKDADYYISCADFEPPANAGNITFISVENDSHDYGGFARLVLEHVPIHQYEFFGFFNSSCLGPFTNADEIGNWLSKFSSKLTAEIGLCGSTINCLSSHSPYFGFLESYLDSEETHYHVQTYAYMLTRNALNLLLSKSFYKYPRNWTKRETIVNYEIGLSKTLINAGLNISCLVPEYKHVDFRSRTPVTRALELVGDPCFLNAINGRTLEPKEVLFVKPSRGFIPEI